MNIRVSAGTAMYMGLKKGNAIEEPTTAYLMIPGETACRGGCTYCPQAKGESEWLSRVSWPTYELDEVIERIKRSDLKRICLQSPDIPGYEDKILNFINELKNADKPISLSSPPISDEVLKQIKGSVDRIGIGIDAVTNDIREEIKPNYNPMIFWDYMGRALNIFGEEKVTAHIIVGIGEDLERLALAMNKVVNAGAKVSLFSYQSKEQSPPALDYYRKAQLLSYLIEEGSGVDESLNIVEKRLEELVDVIEEGDVFLTKGCPDCNRPYYTTRPGKQHRNFPRTPSTEEIMKIKSDLKLI